MMTRDGTPEPVSRDQILRRERKQVNINFLPCSVDHRQDWRLYLVDPYSAICDDHTYSETLLCAILQGILPTNLQTVRRTAFLHIESDPDRLGLLSPTHVRSRRD